MINTYFSDVSFHAKCNIFSEQKFLFNVNLSFVQRFDKIQKLNNNKNQEKIFYLDFWLIRIMSSFLCTGYRIHVQLYGRLLTLSCMGDFQTYVLKGSKRE